MEIDEMIPRGFFLKIFFKRICYVFFFSKTTKRFRSSKDVSRASRRGLRMKNKCRLWGKFYKMLGGPTGVEMSHEASLLEFKAVGISRGGGVSCMGYVKRHKRH